MSFLRKLGLLAVGFLLSAMGLMAQNCPPTNQLPCAVGWYQIPNTALTPVCPTYSEIGGAVLCPQVEIAWGTALMDNNRNRLIIFGGGHDTSYYGNEIFAVDFNANPIAPLLLKDSTHGSAVTNAIAGEPSCPGTDIESYSDGTPGSRHGYNSMFLAPTQDQYWFLLMGGLQRCGGFTNDNWSFTPNILTSNASGGTGWTQLLAPNCPHPSPGGGCGQSGASTPMWAYDPVSDLFYQAEVNTGIFWTYSTATQAYTQGPQNLNACTNQTNQSAAIDPVHRNYYCFGNGHLGQIGLNSPNTFTNLFNTATGCSTFANAAGPGFAWDPVQLLFVGWDNGTLFTYDPVANACATIVASGGPSSTCSGCTGTWGKWQYAGQLGGFVLANGTDQNIWFYRPQSPQQRANQDWTNRSTAPGVVVAHQLSSTADVGGAFGGGGFSDPPNNQFLVVDSAQHISGTASLRFDIQPLGTAGTSGALRYPFCVEPCTNSGFGQNTDFYIQYRQMGDTNFINNAWVANDGSKTYWKEQIIHWANFATGNSDTCGGTELTTINFLRQGFPGTYTQCGQVIFQTPFGSGNFLREQGSYNTVLGDPIDAGYHNYFNPVNNSTGNSFSYPVMTWWTLYYHVHIGTYGQANSHMDAWVMFPGQAPQRFINFTYTQLAPANNEGPYNYISLQPYMTCRCGTPTAASCPTVTITCPTLPLAHTWYSELIVSTQPIAPPATSVPSASTLAPPTNLQAVPLNKP